MPLRKQRKNQAEEEIIEIQEELDNRKKKFKEIGQCIKKKIEEVEQEIKEVEEKYEQKV